MSEGEHSCNVSHSIHSSRLANGVESLVGAYTVVIERVRRVRVLKRFARSGTEGLLHVEIRPSPFARDITQRWSPAGTYLVVCMDRPFETRLP